MSKEAMKLALEALESCDAAHITDGGHQWYDEKLVGKAIEAIEQALAEQALDKMAENARELGLDYEPAQQEPVAWMDDDGNLHREKPHQSYGPEPRPLVFCDTSPPAQRTWVGLVWGELPEDGQNHDFLRGAVWAETKLKEKNQ